MGKMGKLRTPPLHGAMNVISSLLLFLTLGRLFFVLRPHGSKQSQETDNNRVPDWLPTPQQQPQKGHPPTQRLTRQQDSRRKSNSQSVAHSAGRRGDAMPAELQTQFSNNLREGSGVGGYRKSGDNTHQRQRSTTRPVNRRSRREGRSSSSSSNSHDSADNYAWGQGMRVLVFTMDSMSDIVAKSKTGGAAGEIIVKESLTNALTEAGVQVEIAVSEIDFERRTGMMDIYSAVIVDSWTWAGKGWRLKPQLIGRQDRMFIMDFFGADEPHANLRVPLVQHLTAFPIPASQSRTFLGYRVEASQSMPPSGRRVTRRQQGVIWGKAAESFEKSAGRQLISRLANLVELHSTVAPEDARITHDNIVYHGHLSQEEWYRLLRESKFMIGLGLPLSGPSAVDALAAGCIYINPVFSWPTKNIFSSQHPYVAQSVGEPYVCSYEEKDIDAAIGCALKALEYDLPPLVPQELTKEAHATRVRTIFEPLATIEVQR
ncbi:unnamed protein product, partial [Pylaiella littoralis]